MLNYTKAILNSYFDLMFCYLCDQFLLLSHENKEVPLCSYSMKSLCERFCKVYRKVPFSNCSVVSIQIWVQDQSGTLCNKQIFPCERIKIIMIIIIWKLISSKFQVLFITSIGPLNIVCWFLFVLWNINDETYVNIPLQLAIMTSQSVVEIKIYQ